MGTSGVMYPGENRIYDLDRFRARTLEHLDRAYPEGDWRKRFRLGDVLPARVLLVDYQKKVRLCLGK